MSKTLLQLMLENNVVWPVGALYAAQDADDKKAYFYREAPYREQGNPVWQCRIGHVSGEKLKELAGDNETSTISKSEYQSAGGWMTYDGSGSPAQAGIIKTGTLVEVTWSDCSTTQFREGEGSGVAWIAGNPKILCYRIMVDEAPDDQSDPAATAIKTIEPTATIVLAGRRVYRNARVLFQSASTVVWWCDGEEHASKAECVSINPPKSHIASEIIYEQAKVSVAPGIIEHLMKEMGWE